MQRSKRLAVAALTVTTLAGALLGGCGKKGGEAPKETQTQSDMRKEKQGD